MAVKHAVVKNGLSVEDEYNRLNYLFLKKTEDNSISVVNGKCRHRGGPIMHAYKDNDGRYRCPWHDNICPLQDVNEKVGYIYNNYTDHITIVVNSISKETEYLAKTISPKIQL